MKMSFDMSNNRRVLILLFIIPMFCAAVSWKLAHNLPFSYEVSGKFIAAPVGGGECHDPLYDEKGSYYCHILWFNEHCEQGKPAYTGSAPLFEMPKSANLSNEYWESCQFPEQIDPSIAITGRTIYPLVLSTSISNSNIEVGESIKIEATLKISDMYTEKDYKENNVVLLAIEKGEVLQEKLALYSTTFDISPSNTELNYRKLSHNSPQKYTWILSPKENIVGHQWISISLLSEAEDVTKNNEDDYVRDGLPMDTLELEVRKIFGVNPSIVAFLGALASAVITILTIVKLAPEAWRSFMLKPRRKEH